MKYAVVSRISDFANNFFFGRIDGAVFWKVSRAR